MSASYHHGLCVHMAVAQTAAFRMPLSPEVLVTGATGFIGQHLATRLIEQGERVRVLVRDPVRLHPGLRQSAQVIQGDLTEANTLPAAVDGVDVVYHCAANVSTWDKVSNYRLTNVQGVENLLIAIAQQSQSRRPRLVHLSSVDVYGFPSQPCDEQCPTRHTGFGYGDSKIDGEVMVRSFAARHGIDYTILRPANVMGPGSPFIRRIGKELRRGLMLEINGGREDCGFLHVDNLIDAMLWASTAQAAASETFNVRDPVSISWHRLLRDLRAGIAGRGMILNLPFALAEVAARAMQMPYVLLKLRQEPLLHPLIVRLFGRTCGHDASKLARAGCPLGRVSYEAAMQECVRWFVHQEAR